MAPPNKLRGQKQKSENSSKDSPLPEEETVFNFDTISPNLINNLYALGYINKSTDENSNSVFQLFDERLSL